MDEQRWLELMSMDEFQRKRVLERERNLKSEEEIINAMEEDYAAKAMAEANEMDLVEYLMRTNGYAAYA